MAEQLNEEIINKSRKNQNSGKVTENDFLDRLSKRVCKKPYKIIGRYIDYSTKILVEDEFGIHSIAPKSIAIGNYPNIKSAVDKTKYAIAKFHKKHGTECSYEKFVYIKNSEKGIITCNKHGDFNQSYADHLRGNGCPKCISENSTKRQSFTTEDFINKSKKIHEDFYDYALVNYINAQHNVIIICPIHGKFEQRAGTHVKGMGCNACGIQKTKEKVSLTLYEFLIRSKSIHKDKYDYSLVKYDGYYRHINIICPYHGRFTQRPADHLSGKGCNLCARIISNYGKKLSSKDIEFSKDLIGELYVLKFKSDEEEFFKVGISYNTSSRISALKYNNSYKIECLFKETNSVFNCSKKESEILKKYKAAQYFPKIQFSGYTECFSVNPITNFCEFKNLK